MNKNQKNRFINLILLLIAFILIVTNLLLILKITDKDTKNEIESEKKINETSNAVESVEIDNENTENTADKDVKSMNEQERMLYYIDEFFDEIENDNYTKAYDLLSKKFKDNYFDTVEKFKNYALNNFNTDTMVMNFQNIERLGNPINGNIYVVWMKMGNIFDIKNDEEKEDTKFVILEKDYDDFELSFSVKK
ncbi:MAG: hypothetical protein IKF52_06335 [Clostridia bacterium]|nr:hypothetical protein [Clostridia bacterium]